MGWSCVDAPGGVVSQYPPGAALLAAPLYALTSGDLESYAIGNPSKPELPAVYVPLPSFWQATAVAIITTAAAISILALVFLNQWTPQAAWIAAWIAALGTSAWSVAADSLYLHGPAMLWIALGVYLSSQRHYWASGLAFGAAVLTRPHTAVIPAAIGLGLGGLFDPWQGFLILSPFLLLLLPGLFAAWRNSDTWVRAAAIGGLIYLLLQFKMNRYNPGNKTLYRYPLEALTASAPIWQRIWPRSVALAIGIQGVAVWLF